MQKAFLVTLVMAAGVSVHAQEVRTPDTAASRDANLRAYVELLRSDVRTQKVAIITEIMQFTEAEDTRFWPVYREYELELAKINDERMALISEYAAAYDNLTDAMAQRIGEAALDLEAKRHALKVKYFNRVGEVLPKTKAVRFLQVENQLLLVLDLQIAAALPIVK
jgi:hypothetical protein